MFLPHVDVICDLLLNRRTATWAPFVLYNKETKNNVSGVIYASVLEYIIRNNQSNCENNLVLFCLVWGILDRAPEGIKVCKHNILSQVGVTWNRTYFRQFRAREPHILKCFQRILIFQIMVYD